MKLSFFQAGIIGVFVLAAGAGLFMFATYSGSAGKSTIGAVTIWGTMPASGINDALAVLGNDNVDLKSVTYIQRPADTFNEDYVNAVAAGQGPDLVLISQEDLMRLRPTLTPIPYTSVTARQFQDAFADGASIFMSDDGIYGIPFAIDPLVLYYNRPLLSSAGVAAPPATWEAVSGLVPSVVEKTANQGIGRGLIALGTYGNVHDARGILSALFLQAGAPITQGSPSGVRGALSVGTGGTSFGESALRFYTSFANPAQPNYDWNSAMPDSLQQFIAGKLVLYAGYASELSYLRQANPNLDFDVAKLPQPGTAAARVSYGKVYALAIPRAAANPSGAFSAAIALSADDAQAQLVAAAGTLAPAKRALLSADTTDPYAAVFNDQALIVRGWLSPAPATTDGIFAAMIDSVITGRSRPDEALSAAERALSAALQ